MATTELEGVIDFDGEVLPVERFLRTSLVPNTNVFNHSSSCGSAFSPQQMAYHVPTQFSFVFKNLKHNPRLRADLRA